MGAFMKICPDCHTENKIETKFCKACRHVFEISVPVADNLINCPQCHAPNEANKKFCAACGSSLCISSVELRATPVKPVEALITPAPEPIPRHAPKISTKIDETKAPKISKALVIKACCHSLQTTLSNKLAGLTQLVKRKPKQEQESFEPDSERSKIKRILIVACVAGATAVAASFTFSWVMSDSQPVETAQIVPAPKPPVSSPPLADQQSATTQPNPIPSPTPTVVQQTSVVTPPVIASNSISNTSKSAAPVATVDESTATVQPIKKKQTSNQQDLNRQRLLELKRQLGQ
jgi:hypothetical protein